MRKIIMLGIVSASLLCNTAFAGCLNWYSCFYAGAQGGYANMHYSRAWLLRHNGFTSVGKVDGRDYAARAFVGYAFNPFWSLEGGYLFLQKVTFDNINNTADDEINQVVADFMVKATLPLRYAGLFLKAGGAYVHRNELKVGTARYRGNNQYVPVIGTGLSVYVTENITASAEYDQYFKTNDLERIDYFGAGLAYQFS